MTLVIFVQFLLGIMTLLQMVPLSLALAHQMVALLLFTLAVAVLYKLCHPEQREGSPNVGKDSSLRSE